MYHSIKQAHKSISFYTATYRQPVYQIFVCKSTKDVRSQGPATIEESKLAATEVENCNNADKENRLINENVRHKQELEKIAVTLTVAAKSCLIW
jgi:hypothetical protein